MRNLSKDNISVTPSGAQKVKKRLAVGPQRSTRRCGRSTAYATVAVDGAVSVLPSGGAVSPPSARKHTGGHTH